MTKCCQGLHKKKAQDYIEEREDTEEVVEEV